MEKDNFRQILICRNPHSFVAEFLTPPRALRRRAAIAGAKPRQLRAPLGGTKSTPNFELTFLQDLF